MKNKRDNRMDLLRLVFMFMICLVHAVGYESTRWSHWLANISFSGVLGFVLISGFYGIRFSWLKVLKIEGVGAGCAITVVTLAVLWGGESMSAQYFVSEVVRLFKHYWFVHAYVLLMCLAPLTDGLEKLPKAELICRVLPILLAVYGWSFAMLIPGVQGFVPRTEGLVAYSGVTLFGAYLIGRLYRVDGWDNKLSFHMVFPVMLACGFLVCSCVRPLSERADVLAHYNSPFLLVFSVCLFWMLRRGSWQCPPLLRSVISWMTNSVFAIYLIHCNSYGFTILERIEAVLRELQLGDYGIFFVLALCSFIGGFVLDLPRRAFVQTIKFVLRTTAIKGARL